MSKIITHEEFVSRIADVNSNVSILGKYSGMRNHIEAECKVCGYKWSPFAESLSQGHGCPKCQAVENSNRFKISHETFIEKLHDVNQDIEILSKYEGSAKRVKCRCKYDGYIWEAIASSLLQGNGCPKCGISKRADAFRMSHKDFIEKLHRANPNIEILSEYKNSDTKVNCYCKIDGHKWSARPANLLQGQGCPKCSKVYRRTPEEFKSEMKSVNPNIEIITDYTNAITSVKCRCKIDNSIWFSMPSNLLRGTGCPVCNKYKGEKSIKTWLNEHDFYFEAQKRFNSLTGVGGRLLSYDFYIPSSNTLVEYQGRQHKMAVDFGGKGEDYALEQLKIQQEHDNRKRQYAESNGIKLLEIWYTDFDNIAEILTDKLGEKQ